MRKSRQTVRRTVPSYSLIRYSLEKLVFSIADIKLCSHYKSASTSIRFLDFSLLLDTLWRSTFCLKDISLNIKISEQHKQHGKVECVECEKEVESTLEHHNAMHDDNYELDELYYRHPRLKPVENRQNPLVSVRAEEEVSVHDYMYDHVECSH